MIDWMALAGGPVFWILATALVAALALFATQFAMLRRAGADWGDFLQGVENVLSENHPEEALAICDETSTPVSRVVYAAVRHRNLAPDALRETVSRQGRAETARLERRLTAIALIAQTTPLVGLFGAVVGVMRTVMALDTPAIVSRADLSAGIVNALVCIAASLIVSIPAQVMYGILSAQVDRIVSGLENAAGQIVGLLATLETRTVEGGANG